MNIPQKYRMILHRKHTKVFIFILFSIPSIPLIVKILIKTKHFYHEDPTMVYGFWI